MPVQAKSMSILLASAAAVVAAAQPALAQEEAGSDTAIAEIVVTARRQAENLQTVPIAVTAIQPEAFAKTGAFSPVDLTKLAPGLRVSSTIGERSKIVYNIRGQGVTVGALFPAVLPYFAEVPITSEFTTGHYFDLENVQVLRGPQGVRFGRVTDGGAVLIQPHRPTDAFEAYVQGKVGTYDLRGLEGMVNLPIVSDKVLFRAAFESVRQRGFTKNLGSGKWLDNVHYDSGRVSLTLKPADWLENYTVAEFHKADENGNHNALFYVNQARHAGLPSLALLNAAAAQQASLGARRVINGSPLYGEDWGIFSDREQTLVSNITTVRINDNFRIRNIFGFTDFTKNRGYDFDGSGVVLLDVLGFPGRYMDQHRQYSNEIQLQGQTGPLDFTVGYYRDRQKVGLRQEGGSCGNSSGPTAGSGSPNTTCFVTPFHPRTKSSAIYGQAELDLSEWAQGLKINGGLRRTTDKNTTYGRTVVTNLGTIFNPATPLAVCEAAPPPTGCLRLSGTFHATTWEAGASYEANDNLFAYVTYRKGYRPGGFNSQTSTASPDGSFGPEYDKSLEIGVKTKGVIGTMPFRFNVAGFTDRYTDIQKRRTFTDATGRIATDLANVTGARIKGLEFEATLLPLRGLDVNANLALTRSKFDRDNVNLAALFDPLTGGCNPAAPVNLGFCPYNVLALTPKTQLSVSVGYTLPLSEEIGRVRLAGDLYHQSRMAIADSSQLNPDATMEPYTIGNVSVTWSDAMGQPIDVSVFVTNVTNKTYLSSILTNSHRAASGVASHMWAPPRMVGATVRYRFGALAR